MISRQRGKVRLVKCPKCANILPEPEQCPLYACGGCETILQAKYYTEDRKATKSGSLEQRIVQSNNEGHASDDGEPNSSSPRPNSPGEVSADKNGCKDKNSSDESCKQEQIGAPNSAPRYHASNDGESNSSSQRSSSLGEESTDRNGYKNKNSADKNSAGESCKQEQIGAPDSAPRYHASNDGESYSSSQRSSSLGEESTDRNGYKNKNDADESCKLEQIGSPNLAHEYHASLSEESSNRGNGFIENKTDLVGSDHEVNQNREHLETVSSANVASSEGVSMSALENKDSDIEDDTTDGNQKQIGVAESDKDASDQNDSEVTENKEPLKYAEGHTGFEDKESQNPVLNVTEKEGDLPELSHEAAFDHQEKVREVGCAKEPAVFNEATEIEDDQHELSHKAAFVYQNQVIREMDHAEEPAVLNDYPVSENKEPFQLALEKGTAHDKSETSKRLENVDDFSGHQHVKSTNGSEILQPVNTQEIINSHEVVPGSLTKDSLTYEGSISSFDGNENQALEHHENFPDDSLPGNGAVAGYAGSEESPEWSNNQSSRVYQSPRIQNRTKNSSQVWLNGKMKSTMVEEQESVGENVIPERNRTRRIRERIPARGPFYQNSEVANETGSSSGYIHDELPPRMHHRPFRYEDREPWARNMYSQKANIRRRSHDTYSYETSGEFYHGSRYYNHIDRRLQRGSWHQNGCFPSMPYSADGPNGRYRMQDPYMYRHHDNDYWWSPQSPVSGVYRRPGLYEWDPYGSSPPRFPEYEHYPWAHDPISMSDDQRRKGQMTMKRLYSKNKSQMVRRYFQPMAGGAPFVTCDFCFNVLQLPEHFLASRSSRSGTHQLRCGDCSKILDFKLDNTSILAPSKPNANADSHDHVSHSRGSRSVPEESRGGEQRSDNAAGSSSQTKEMKVTWKLHNRKSPLHRLMGYSSLTPLLDGHKNAEEK